MHHTDIQQGTIPMQIQLIGCGREEAIALLMPNTRAWAGATMPTAFDK